MEKVQKVLILGGTGIIGREICRQAVSNGYDVYCISRSDVSHKTAGTTYIKGDAYDSESLATAVVGSFFDKVIDLLSFNVEQLEAILDALDGTYGHYVFVSSATIYEDSDDPIQESNRQIDSGWNYPLHKIECEKHLEQKFTGAKTTYTIVRPYITYSEQRISFAGWEGYDMLERISTGTPIAIGREIESTVTTLTHSSDLARGIVGLLDSASARNEAFHITSDESITWLEVYEIVADITSARLNIVDTEESQILAVFPELKGKFSDRTKHRLFDNSKLKAAVDGYTAEYSTKRGYEELIDQINSGPKKINYVFHGRMDSVIRKSKVDRTTWHRVKAHRKQLLSRNIKARLMYYVGYYRILLVTAIQVKRLLGKRTGQNSYK